MKKIFSLFKTKKFWTLVAAIVAAFSAFFLSSSCTGFLKVYREGIHHDTVRYEQVVKHKDYLSCKLNHKELTPFCSRLCSNSTNSVLEAISYIGRDNVGSTGSGFISNSIPIWPCELGTSVQCSQSIMLAMSTTVSSMPLTIVNECSSRLPLMNYGSSFLMSLVPLFLVRKNRRGKSKGKGTKSIPLSGRHF